MVGAEDARNAIVGHLNLEYHTVIASRSPHRLTPLIRYPSEWFCKALLSITLSEIPRHSLAAPVAARLALNAVPSSNLANIALYLTATLEQLTGKEQGFSKAIV